jgi:hypothetical protein
MVTVGNGSATPIRVRNGLNEDSDPEFYINLNPDPGSRLNADYADLDPDWHLPSN